MHTYVRSYYKYSATYQQPLPCSEGRVDEDRSGESLRVPEVSNCNPGLNTLRVWALSGYNDDEYSVNSRVMHGLAGYIVVHMQVSWIGDEIFTINRNLNLIRSTEH